ncbi:hypothetical protein LTR10_011713 [Elasticomyces elasticus]|uniref:NmrA-like domain-containing protein n=1 Tax=Exophiala sideris TaxID=1016849 RepID=A0ABR0JDV0_9EURO|nr:hypothetical protein LTR10_011713 [Elasticomyces elasticus]KAK5061908.1 hypothetical protein LTR69_005092 [Exophiala sideris]KAK5184608.1 hypothetical protein LTR44_003283 [Eurotiomycetes sp. CCFEE 6388]
MILLIGTTSEKKLTHGMRDGPRVLTQYCTDHEILKQKDTILRYAWVIPGMYYYIARIFLAHYNPQTLKVGLGSQRLRRTMDEEVLKNAEAVCGISLASPLAAARITACTAIVACGPWFHVRPVEQQDLLLRLLKKAEVENALPTASLVQGLKEEWAWN